MKWALQARKQRLVSRTKYAKYWMLCMARASTSLRVQEIYEDIIWFVLIKYMTFSWWVQTWCICDNTTHTLPVCLSVCLLFRKQQPDGLKDMHRPIFPFVAPEWRSCMHRCTRWANYTCTYSKHICMSLSQPLKTNRCHSSTYNHDHLFNGRGAMQQKLPNVAHSFPHVCI